MNLFAQYPLAFYLLDVQHYNYCVSMNFNCTIIIMVDSIIIHISDKFNNWLLIILPDTSVDRELFCIYYFEEIIRRYAPLLK